MNVLVQEWSNHAVHASDRQKQESIQTGGILIKHGKIPDAPRSQQGNTKPPAGNYVMD